MTAQSLRDVAVLGRQFQQHLSGLDPVQSESAVCGGHPQGSDAGLGEAADLCVCQGAVVFALQGSFAGFGDGGAQGGRYSDAVSHVSLHRCWR